MFSVLVNSSPAGFFPGKRGLRQGDPLSPYLFVLSMEIFSRLLRNLPGKNLSYHLRCSRMQLTHLIFADDLLIFSKGDLSFIAGIKESLSVFANWSGLHANDQKTGIYFGGIDDS